MEKFEYEGRVRVMTQEGGYALPGVELVRDAEDDEEKSFGAALFGSVGFFAQKEAAMNENTVDLGSEIARILGADPKSFEVVTGNIKITIEKVD